MKAFLKFDLSDPDDRDSHALMLKAPDMHAALWEISNFIRSKVKHGELSVVEEAVWNEVREHFYNALGQYDVEL